MSAAPAHRPIVHFVGSIPLPDAETVFRTLAAATGPHLKRLPDGETARLDPATVKTGDADTGTESWRLFDRLQQEGVIPAGVKFQISRRPRSRRPTTTWCRPTGRR